jgi:hypothetical protein
LRFLLRLFVLSLFSVTAFAGLTEIVDQHNNLQLGKATTISAPYEVAVAHARFQLQEGVVTPVMAGATKAGVFLSGSGTYSYETTDQDEFSAVRYNAKHSDVAAKVTPDRISFSGTFKSLLLIANGVPDPVGSPGAAPADVFEALQEQFGRRWTNSPPAHLLALRALNTPSARMTIA